MEGWDESAGVKLGLRRNSSAKPPALVSFPVLTHFGNTTSLRLDDGCERRPCCQVGIEQVQNVPEDGEGSGSLINKAPGSLWRGEW